MHCNCILHCKKTYAVRDFNFIDRIGKYVYFIAKYQNRYRAFIH